MISRLASGELEHSSPGPADQQWRMRLLHGLGLPLEPGDLVVPAPVVDRPVAEQSLHHMNRLLQALHAPSRVIERNACHRVLVSQPAGPDSPFEPPFGDHIQRRQFLRVHDWMPEVIARHQSTHPQPARHTERRTEGRHRRELVSEMIRHHERREPEVLNLPAQSGPIPARRSPVSTDPEAERTSQYASEFDATCDCNDSTQIEPSGRREVGSGGDITRLRRWHSREPSWARWRSSLFRARSSPGCCACGSRRLATWAAVPVLSIAAVFLLGEVTDVVGAPFGVPAFVILVLALSGAVVASARFRGTRRVPSDSPEKPAHPSAGDRLAMKVAYVLLVLGVLIGLGTWFTGINGEPSLPPGGDATRHGFMVGRIEHGQSIDVADVVVFDADGKHRSADYYPLAVHASAAVSSRLVGADAGSVLMAFTVFFAAIVLPLGMFVLARLLAPGLPLVAGFTAFVTPTLLLFPYTAFQSGVVPAIVGISMVPISLVLIVRAVWPDNPGRTRAATLLMLVAAALALVAALSAHSSQLPFIAFLVLLLVLERALRERNVQMLVRALGYGSVVAVLALVMLAPTLRDLVAGASERSSILFVKPDHDYRSFVKPILTLETGEHLRARAAGLSRCNRADRRSDLGDPTPVCVGGRLDDRDGADDSCQHL